jgi:cobalt-zinc-cadmium efflux system membrane fusion protein
MNKSIILYLVFLVACKGNTDQPAAQTHVEAPDTIELTDAQAKSAGVKLGKPEQRQISGVVKATGQLDVPPQQLVSVSVPLGGFLKSTSLLPGSRVTKGQVIAVIENPDYIQLQQDYLEARNQSEYNKTEYDRQQELAKENVNAQKVVQQAKTNYLNGLARVNGLAARLTMINIDPNALKAENISGTANVYSPINGFVTDVNVNIGKFVNPADVLFTIVDTEHLHAELTIFEKDIPKIHLNQKVRFTLANETKERTATVYLVGREIKPDRTINIHCHIDKEDKNLLPGMFLTAIVETGGAMVTALPNEALIAFQGKTYVIVPTDANHYEMIEIATGPSESGYTEVTLPENLNSNSDFVVEGGYAILSQMKNTLEEE